MFGIAIDKEEERHIALGIADDALVVFQLQQKGVALVDAGAFVKELLTGLPVEGKTLVFGLVLVAMLFQRAAIVVEGKILAVGSAAVRTTIQVQL